jgi:hypothetical protein
VYAVNAGCVGCGALVGSFLPAHGTSGTLDVAFPPLYVDNTLGLPQWQATLAFGANRLASRRNACV